jgi:hypothetical protein
MIHLPMTLFKSIHRAPDRAHHPGKTEADESDDQHPATENHHPEIFNEAPAIVDFTVRGIAMA